MTDIMSDAMKSALLWLRNRNGDGVFDRTQVLTAAGQRAGVTRQTWNRLATLGFVEFYQNKRRLRVTSDGHAVDLFGVTESRTVEVEIDDE